MYKGFNLQINENFFSSINYHKSSTQYSKNENKIKEALDKYLDIDEDLDGNKIIEDWFPDLKYDIFISHSHNDLELAKIFSEWLYTNFKLTSFIDSCVWKYSDDLLQKIDYDYCYNKESDTYSYQKRNFSTSHVHIMLSTALMNMIYNTECIIFLNTPNSIDRVGDIIKNSTKSPWIYHELKSTKLLEVGKISDYRPDIKIDLKPIKESYSEKKLSIKYKTELNHLIDLESSDLIKWNKAYQMYPRALHALDVLYNLLI